VRAGAVVTQRTTFPDDSVVDRFIAREAEISYGHPG
jgi:hypothetical protein